MSNDDKLHELEERLALAQHELLQLKKELHDIRSNQHAQQHVEHSEQRDQQHLNKQMEAQHREREQGRDSTEPSDRGQTPTEKVTAQNELFEMDWEHIIAKVWLPRVFIFVLILGVLWGFNAAISYGLITEPVRVIIGFIAAVLLAYFGVRGMGQQREILSHVLLGGSIAIATLSVFAGHMLYDFFQLPVAFLLYVITFAFGLYAGFHYKSQIILILSAFGGFLVPILVGPNGLNDWVFALYEAFLSVGLLFLSLKHRYVVAYYAAFLSLHLTYLIAQSSHVSELPFMLGALLQHVVLLVLFYKRDDIQASKIATLYVSFCFTLSWVNLFYDDAVKWILLIGSFLFSVITYFAFEQKKQIKSVLLSITTLSWFMYVVSIANVEYMSLIFVVQGTLAYWVGIRYQSVLQQVTGVIVFFFGMIFTIAATIPEWISYETLAWIGLVICLYAGYRMTKSLYEGAGLILVLDSLLVLVLITQLTSISTVHLAVDYRHLAVSLIWCLYAIAIIGVGMWKDKKSVRLTGVIFLFFTLLKVIFYDIPGVSLEIRAILFIILGLIGLVVSRFFYKKK